MRHFWLLFCSLDNHCSIFLQAMQKNDLKNHLTMLKHHLTMAKQKTNKHLVTGISIESRLLNAGKKRAKATHQTFSAYVRGLIRADIAP